MQYLEITLENSLASIFNIAKESFTQFYPINKFMKRLEGKKYWIYVAKEDEIVGFKIFYEDNDGQIYDWLDAVKPRYRRRGISSALMNMEIDFARQKGYSKVKLKTHEGHPEMIALCNKFGFIEVNRELHHWKDSIDREAILFELNL
jgi:ribosomal protein S18 acetylase RimI-like enzyme